MNARKNNIDMLNGPIASGLLRFALPLMLTTAMQLMFNTVDMAVVGRFTSSSALAAVGATVPVVNLLVGIFTGLSVGVNVLVSRYYGAQNKRELSETVHTSILLSVLIGVVLTVFGIAVSRGSLEMTGTPVEVLDEALLYVRIYFLGMPVNILYNFGSAVMRAVGDSKRPLYYLITGGIVNVILNLILVIVFRMGVAGVAIATVVSEAISAVLVVIYLMRSHDICRLELKKLRLHGRKVLAIIQIGLPAGIQGALISLSNALIQSVINSFGAAAIAGNTASTNVDGMICTTFSNAMYQAVMTFVSQNVGAGKFRRIDRIVKVCCVISTVGTFALGMLTFAFGEELLSIFTADPEVIAFGMIRVRLITTTFFICGLMNVFVGCIRGFGVSVLPTVVSLTGACGLRVLWIYTIFAAFPTLEVMYISFPAIWVLTTIAHMISYYYVRRKYPREDIAPAA